jgi:ABC-type sugar transport system ATPase subunit
VKNDTTPALSLRGLTKTYGEATVLNNVDIDVAPGEVRALLGENGAGKSTTIKIVSGVVRATAGSVSVDGRAVSSQNPRDADRAGIATLHQELAIAPGLSVAENVSLGRSGGKRFGLVRWRELNRIAREVFDELSYVVDVTRDAAELSPIGKTMTSIGRAISLDAKVLILDEPTASLTDAETEQLLAVVKRVADRGVAVLYVSHRLNEVFRIADTYTILRNGELVEDGRIDQVDVDHVITTMSGRAIDSVFPPRVGRGAETAVSVRGLHGHGVGPLSFDVGVGEIFGIAGLAGAGRSEVLAMLAGARTPRGGSVELFGKGYSVRSVSAAHRRGVVLVPEERRSEGLLPDTVQRNMTITTLGRHATAGVMSSAAERRYAQQQWDTYDVRGSSLSQDAMRLSGGNQQKIVLAKFLSLEPRLILLDEPTRGVDVGTKSEIYRLVAERASAGASVIVVSSELPELLGLCHRIAVIHE